MPEDYPTARDPLPHLLATIWTRGTSTKSNLSKRHADLIAEAASRGLLTVLLGDAPTRTWRITETGLRYLTESLWNPSEE